MAQERFEWLEIPQDESEESAKTIKSTFTKGGSKTVLGKRCPECDWLDEETSTRCFRCGYRYNVNQNIIDQITQLGVTLPPRIIETPQNLENFFRTHGRIRPPEPLPLYNLRNQAEILSLSRGFDQLLCLDEVRVDHYEHQIETALRALRDMRGRALLADEVGLGKTIEAGIITKELLLRGLVQSVLVLTPASLTEQWREELSEKFNEEFTVIEKPEQWRELRDAEHGRWITSIDRAKRKSHADQILARDFDLMIIDEAHKLKNRNTQVWKFVNQIRKRYVLMLTATPIQNDLMELYSLINILSPGQLGTVRGFKRHFLNASEKHEPKNGEALRGMLNDVMIRNRRSKVAIQFPRRRAAIYHLTMSEPEWLLYREVTEYIRHRFKSVQNSKFLRLTLIILQRELSSSPQAVASTLRKIVNERADTDETKSELRRFLELAESIPVGRKLLAVKEILEGEEFAGKVLIFTEYRATLEAIVSYLHSQKISVTGFHGGMNIQQKENAVADFKKDVRVMVSTESGAEGRNLQFCNQLINFDLPWNPMRVEQRIGRLHRLGQESDVTILNLSCNETIEAHIIDLLARKIRMFELVIGELDLILGNVEGAKSFEELIREAWQSSGSDEDLEERMEEIGGRLDEARGKYDVVRDRNMQLDEALDL